MSLAWSSSALGAMLGFFLGFTFGVGCALAVMYSIYLGGYRAAVKDAALPVAPERLAEARARLTRVH
jgi:hypothetical protein